MELKTISVTADFSGGLDLVFNGKMQITLQLNEGSKISDIIAELQKNHANDKKDMFSSQGKIRNGILVLVNEADWELAEKQQTVLENKDKVSFISTLHGG